ncbi:transcription initiation protein [Streptomyces sp. NPDC002265]|uniref:YciI family protein n=1 Tax=Streptomyces sp. NPDC002265 TaxID=3154415 RepID=UPI0033311378
MRYALLVCVPPADDGRTGPGRMRGGTWLRPAADATTVRAEADEILLGDGPYPDLADGPSGPFPDRGPAGHVAGLDLVEAADLDEAIALAAAHSRACGGAAVEVRPVWE